MELSAVLAWLDSQRDEAYRAFNESLIPGAEGTSYGVQLPKLRKFSKEIVRGDWEKFLAQTQESMVYEVVLLRALVIAGAPCEYGKRLKLLENFIPSITNWAVCDCLCSSLKSAKQHLPETWEFLQPYLQSSEEFSLRFAVVMLLDYFLTAEYIDQVLEILQSIRHEGYYVNMAVAWALSAAFVGHREKVLPLLEGRCLTPWVQNKTIQKCPESRRVSDEDKAYLAGLRI
jgi:3-methyladenine DNA glycosylase AlkD